MGFHQRDGGDNAAVGAAAADDNDDDDDTADLYVLIAFINCQCVCAVLLKQWYCI